MSKKIRQLRKYLSKQQYKEVLAVSDMTQWAQKYCATDISMHKYAAARCKNPRRVIVSGRRCGKTEFITLDVLYHLFTGTRKKIVIAGPYSSFVQELFYRMRKYIDKSEELKQMVIRDVSAPFYEISVSNGSRVRGLSLEGDTIATRGQDADHIYVEEFFEVDQAEMIGGLFPILQTTPECTITLVGSPPARVRDSYWSPEDLDLYEKFHWSPMDTVDRVTVMRDRPYFSSDVWHHEILGEWDGYEGS